MKKNNELRISELEMNMDEAMELFSSETLDDMQMASVYGSGWWSNALKWVGEQFASWGLQEAFNEIKDNFFGEEGATPPDDWGPTGIEIIEPDGTRIIIESADSATINRPDRSVYKFYGIGNEPTPY